MMNIKKILAYILADNENFALENRLLLSAILVGIFTSLLGLIISLFTSSSLTVLIVALSLFFGLIIIYYFVRIKRKFKSFVIPLIIISFISVSIVWIFDGGINGSNLFVGFVILILALIIVPDKNKKYVISLFITLNIIIYLIQFYRPDLIINFSSETTRWVDSLITAIYSSFFIFVIIKFLHKNYTIEKQRAEENEEKYKTIVNLIGEGLGVIDFNENFLYVNPTAEQIFDVKPGTLVGRNLREFLTQDQLEIVRTQTEKRKSGKSNTYEITLTCDNNKTKNVLITAAPSYNKEGEAVESIGVFRDITKRKGNEIALKNAIATKDKFFSIIAHDLKSPFNSLLGFSNLLLENHTNYDEEKREKYIKLINESSIKTYKLLDNLLTWSRSQSGKIEFSQQEINIKTLINEIVLLFQPTAQNKSIRLINDIETYISVYADENMINTVLRNLISNAIKFTPKGGEIIVNAHTITDENNQKFTEISVKDNGLGISPEIQTKLFKIEENISTRGTEKEAGTGLGLILCKEFIEKHGGTIWVESELGKGSTFYFTIPKEL